MLLNMADTTNKIIDPFINVKNIDPEGFSMDNITPGGNSQNFFGNLTVQGTIYVKDADTYRVVIGNVE